jgi:exonuclease III
MATPYRIGSFNIKKLGRNSMLKKDLTQIANLIKDNKLDIVAIQEISSKEALKEILIRLDGTLVSECVSAVTNARDAYAIETRNWESRWAKPISKIGGKSAEEGYAFIWKKNRIELPKNKRGEKSEPDIYLNGGQLIRPPFYGRFIVSSCNAEIRLINTHVVFKKTPKEDDYFEEDESAVSDYEERIKEYKVLAEEIYRRVYASIIGTRQILTFILGDYNLCLSGSGSSDQRAVMPENIARYKYGRHMIKTIQDQKTTIRGKSRKDPDRVFYGEDNLANNYDHFSYEERLEESIGIQACRIDAANVFQVTYQTMSANDGSIFRNEFEAYREKISDHLPIMMTINISKR